MRVTPVPRRAAAATLLLLGLAGAALAAAPAASADAPVGELVLHQSADCSGPGLPGGSLVTLPFSISVQGFAPNTIGVLEWTSEDGQTASNRFTTGDTGTTCDAIGAAAFGAFQATFVYTDDDGSHAVPVAGVITDTLVGDPSPTQPTSPWTSPTATAKPTSSASPTHHSATPTASGSTAAAGSGSGGDPTTLPSTGNSAQLPRTGADPVLVWSALGALVAGVGLYVGAGAPARARRH